MTDDAVRDEIAFIRRAIEEGRGYATQWSSDILVWGVLVAAAALGNYATIRAWWAIEPRWLWAACVALGWIYCLRRSLSRLLPGSPKPSVVRPMVRALQMLWVGCGIFLTTLYAACSYTDDLLRQGGWFAAVCAGVMGIGFFTSASLANLAWMRWVAVGWWVGEIAIYALRHQVEVLPLMAVLWLLLLALPGLVLLRSRGAPSAP
jgi:hypothetical protein